MGVIDKAVEFVADKKPPVRDKKGSELFKEGIERQEKAREQEKARDEKGRER
jgi:hypothetical protein